MNGFAHKYCILKVGLLEAPKSNAQRERFNAVFQERLTSIITGIVDEMTTTFTSMEPRAAFTAVMDRVTAYMPIARPTH